MNLPPDPYAARNAEIVRLYRSGMSAAEIADLYSLSPGRVHQILWKAGLTAADGGEHVRKQARAQLLNQIKELA